MARTITSAFQTHIESAAYSACLLAALDFDSGVVRVTTAAHEITWAGDTYLGAGALAFIEPIRETSTTEAIGLRVGLAGAISSYVGLALSEPTHGRRIRIWYAVVDAGWVVVADPVLEFVGRMGPLIIGERPNDNGEIESTVALICEQLYADQRKPNGRIHSLEDHKRDNPGDTIHRHLPRIADAQIVWPSAEFWKQ